MEQNETYTHVIESVSRSVAAVRRVVCGRCRRRRARCRPTVVIVVVRGGGGRLAVSAVLKDGENVQRADNRRRCADHRERIVRDACTTTVCHRSDGREEARKISNLPCAAGQY